MVSNVNLVDDIGKHIAIYPLLKDNQAGKIGRAFDLTRDIEGASFDFTASQYAWSIKEQRSAIEDGYIKIKPKDTVIIFTNEVLSLDEYYAGACYSKLTFSMRGINHSSSPLKPGYTGRMSVSLHNDSTRVFSIGIGDPIVVVMLSKLNKPSNITNGNGKSSRLDILNSLGISITDEERKAITEYDDRTKVMSSMKAEENYKEFKKGKRKKRKYIIQFFVLAIICAGLSVLAYFGEIKDVFVACIGGIMVQFVDKCILK